MCPTPGRLENPVISTILLEVFGDGKASWACDAAYKIDALICLDSRNASSVT